MTTDSRWLYDEFNGMAMDFHDPEQVATYDARQNTQLGQERELVKSLGIGPEHSVLEYGPGTGAFTRAAAEAGAQVYAVDVSQAMLTYARCRIDEAGLNTVQFHQAGFLSYAHAGPPVDFIVTQFAFHHLPDFWKSVALAKMNDHLKLGGRLFLKDVVFSFAPENYQTEIERWIDGITRDGSSFTRADFEAHIRDEHSTYAWILEGMLRGAGFRIDAAEAWSPVYAQYLCSKVHDGMSTPPVLFSE